MGKRSREGMKSGVAGRKSSAGAKRSSMTGASCQLGKVIYTSRREAELVTGKKAKRCGRCNYWHA